jgi:hypothetical protein
MKLHPNLQQCPFNDKILDVPKTWQNKKLQQKMTTNTVE